ncbi:MAG: D-alanyl-D-alanine carboxypeptidase family protein [Pseudomonadota bacterium]
MRHFSIPILVARGLLLSVALSFPSLVVAQEAILKTDAKFAVIMDYDTGEVLFEKDADTPTAPASMSKLMTIAIVFEKLKNGELSLADPFAVSEKAWRMGGSKMWVRVDTEITLENLLRGIIIQSGNDACIVVAENIAGSEAAFADLMNKKAREWGLNNSYFANPTGWPDPGQKMSMRDLASLSRKIITEYPDYYALFNEREFTWEKISQSNRNPILYAFDGADGLKTGHTEESGYGVVASAVKGEQRRIIVINGLESEKDRSKETLRLMNIAFNDFNETQFFSADDEVGDALVFAGLKGSVPLRLADDVNLLMHRKLKDDVTAKVVYEGPVSAPIKEGQQIGYLRIGAPGQSPREYPLFAGSSIRPIGFFGRVGLAARKLLARPEHFDDGAPSPEEGRSVTSNRDPEAVN